MNTNEQYLRHLSERCKVPNAYARLERIDAGLRQCGADDLHRRSLLEIVVDNVTKGTDPEEDKLITIERFWKEFQQYPTMAVTMLGNMLSPVRPEALPRKVVLHARNAVDSHVPRQKQKARDIATEDDEELPAPEYRQITNQPPRKR